MRVLLGPPGTGKTTFLLDIVDRAMKDGVSPEEIAFVSFTKKSVDEARDRAALKFNLDPKRFNYFRTIHSMAFRQLGLSTTQVMVRASYRELGDALGLSISGYVDQDAEIDELASGDQLVFIESLSRMCMEKIEDTYDRLSPDISLNQLKYYQRALVEYKDAKLLIDYTDMLVDFHKTPHACPRVKLLLVDEAQDLCRLQWKIIENMEMMAARTYVAGDDDQAVFRWSGADVDYFLKGVAAAEKVKVLNKSYRVPRAVHGLAEKIIKEVKGRKEKLYGPRDAAGGVTYITGLDEVDLDKGQWLLLVRNGYMTRSIINHLQLMGYIYKSKHDNPATSEAVAAAKAWERLRAKKPVALTEIENMLGMMGVARAKKKAFLSKKALGPYIFDTDLIKEGLFSPEKTWYEALVNISPDEREYMRAARRRGESFSKEPRITVSTIHGAKGGEADNVVVFTDMAPRSFNGMQEFPDDEARVYYVAVTRTRENLYIVEPRTRYFFII